MKGNVNVLAVLDELLADELTDINQYMVHSEMCENWGYNKLHVDIRSGHRYRDRFAESHSGSTAGLRIALEQ